MTSGSGLDGHAVADWLGAAKAALDFIRGARRLLPNGDARDRLDLAITQAAEALARSDAALAHQLGFQLCMCVFPPPIMLWREARGAFVCPNEDCNREWRPPSKKAVPAALVCPLCEDEMQVISEHPHPEFGFAGLKVHSVKCRGCDNQVQRDYHPGQGYK